MKNTLKALAIVAGALLTIAAVFGAIVGAVLLASRGHGLSVGITCAVGFLTGMVWLIKHDLDDMDAARAKDAANTREAGTKS